MTIGLVIFLLIGTILKIGAVKVTDEHDGWPIELSSDHTDQSRPVRPGSESGAKLEPRSGYGYPPSSYGYGASIFGFDSVLFGLALAAFAAFLIQFIVNLVNAGRRRKKRSITGEEEDEDIIDLITRWVVPVLSGNLQQVWDDLDPDQQGLFSVVYKALPDWDSLSDVGKVVSVFADMGKNLRDSHRESQEARINRCAR
jgi:hypothetical protein